MPANYRSILSHAEICMASGVFGYGYLGTPDLVANMVRSDCGFLVAHADRADVGHLHCIALHMQLR